MIRRWVTWVLCLAAIVAGSLAWAGFVYLNTWADPGATVRVTNAVLDDPGARDEVLAPVRSQVMGAIPAEFGVTQAQVDAALVAVLSDPFARDRIAQSFVTDDGDLRFSAASDSFRAELARTQPQLAPIIEQTPTRLSLPDVSTAPSLRNAADTWVWRLAAVSGLFFLASFVLGDARLTARRFGYWAVATGFLWVIGAPIATWLAPRVSGGIDDTARVVVREYTAPIGPWALGLTIAGLVAIAGSFLVPKPAERPVADSAPRPAAAPAQARTSRRRAAQSASSPAPYEAAAPTGRMPVAETREIPVTRRASDTQTMAVQAPGRTAPAEAGTAADRRDADTGEIDVWAAYDAPTPRSDV
ncbi:MAG: hypothetical protein KDB37_16045 [Ilumatobacter sp.]|nr:hypothetical protein [Ilumatobacter sp.]